MTEEEKAVEKVLDEIVANILKWQNRKIELDGRCCSKEREKGFQEGRDLAEHLSAPITFKLKKKKNEQ